MSLKDLLQIEQGLVLLALPCTVNISVFTWCNAFKFLEKAIEALLIIVSKLSSNMVDTQICSG